MAAGDESELRELLGATLVWTVHRRGIAPVEPDGLRAIWRTDLNGKRYYASMQNFPDEHMWAIWDESGQQWETSGDERGNPPWTLEGIHFNRGADEH